MTGASKKPRQQRRDATVCLLLGIFSCASLPVFFALASLQHRVRPFEDWTLYAVIGRVGFALFLSAIPAGVLALVLGRRANRAIRRIEGRIFGDDRAKRGMVLGTVGSGIWSLVIFFGLLPYSRLGGGVSAVGSLRTINTAAITYSSQYHHGFPLRLSYLGIDPFKTNDRQAGLIDSVLATGTKAGYRFYYFAGPVDSRSMILTYTVHADPVDPSGGHLYYFTDETGVIRKQSKWEANVSSPPLY